MSMHTEQHQSELTAADSTGAVNERALQALARDLPHEQDGYLKRLIEFAIKRCRKSGFPVQRLLAAFAGRSHVHADFELVLETVRTRTFGCAAEARACAWLLGVA